MRVKKWLHAGVIAAVLLALLLSVTAFAGVPETEPEAQQTEQQSSAGNENKKEETEAVEETAAASLESEISEETKAAERPRLLGAAQSGEESSEETESVPEETSTEPETETDPVPEVKNGWVTDEETGSKYYYVDDTLVTGLQELEGEDGQTGSFFFDEETGEMQTAKLISIEEDDYFFGDDGRMLKNKNRKIDGAYYYFDSTGKMVKDAVTKLKATDGNEYYYGFDADGKMLTGWQIIGGAKYYFDSYHHAYTGGIKTVGKYDYGFAEDGKVYISKAVKIGDDYYYFNKNGVMLTDTVAKLKETDGNAYYFGFDASGKMLTGWQTIGGAKYYFDASHHAYVNGIKTVGKYDYGFAADGKLIISKAVKFGDDYYYFNKNGVKLTDTVVKLKAADGNTYYYGFDASGKMLTGWQTIGGAKYYFNASHHAYANVMKKIGIYTYGFAADGKLLISQAKKFGSYNYYFNKNGVRLENTLAKLYAEDGNAYYYGFAADGKMLTGWQEFNGNKYYFNKSTYAANMNCVSKIGSYLYGFDSTAKLVRGWFTLNGDHYYFVTSNAHGYVGVTRTIDGVSYVFDENGKEKTGWVTISGKKYYYVPETGKLANGAVKINGKPYYFKKGVLSGATKFSSDGHYYIVKSDGSFVSGKGWTKYNGFWYYIEEDGYSILMDTESVIDPEVRKQYGFIVKINKKTCTVTVYAYKTTGTDAGTYCLPVRSFVCSPGQRTPTGWHTITKSNRWVTLVGPEENIYTYGHWGLLYNIGDNDDGSESKRYFHSVYYDAYYDKATNKYKGPKDEGMDEFEFAATQLNVRAWNMLGKICSHGCIRMETVNVRWLYKLFKEDIISQTKAAQYNGGKGNVYIYESSTAGPYGKMAACCKLPSWHTWDPTDPNMKYKCQEKGCHNY